MATKGTDYSKYLNWNPWSGSKDDGDIRALSVKMVVTRKPHNCVANINTHEIPRGSLVRREKAVHDGEWRSWYACLDCIDTKLALYGGH